MPIIRGGAGGVVLDSLSEEDWVSTSTDELRRPFTNLSKVNYVESPTGKSQKRHNLDLVLTKYLLMISGDKKTAAKVEFLRDYLSAF
jgi:hypothetical protein